MIKTERLRELLDYDPDTGVFRWKNPNRGKAKVGAEVTGWAVGKGYKMVGLDEKRFYLHRLAWQHVYGQQPKQLDHINGNKLDNRICNLRECSHSQNAANMFGRGKSGFKGVYYEERSGRYFAAICKDYKQTNLGTFDTPEEAHAAYTAAAKKLFGQFARVA